MTEQEWLESINLSHLTECARANLRAARTKAGRRRLRLFSCACLRRIWHLLDERGQRVIELTERHAYEAPANVEAWKTLQREVASGWPGQSGPVGHEIRCALLYAVASGYPTQMASLTAQAVVRAVGRVAQAKRLAAGEHPRATLAARGVAMAKEFEPQAQLFRDIFGNPFRPLARRKFPADVRGLAQACYEGNQAVVPMLADALADLGEDAAAAHLRQPTHVRGCHVVDWVRGVA
jgi:hypothetical protein